LEVGDGQIRFNRGEQGRDDDPANEVKKKDGGKEKDRSYLGTKRRVCFGGLCRRIVQVKFLSLILRSVIYQITGKKTNRLWLTNSKPTARVAPKRDSDHGEHHAN
jgi:hypothetical protein